MRKKIKDLTLGELENIMKKYHDDDKHNCSDCPFINMCGNPRSWFVEGILNKGIENKVEV